MLQTFMRIVSVTILVLAALVAERRRAEAAEREQIEETMRRAKMPRWYKYAHLSGMFRCGSATAA
jgi:hypothetical protein